MTIQISIIGLGQIGASVGLALANQQELVQRMGHDRELSIARRAEKLGAVDRVSLNLIKAVSNADLVLLSLPVDQIHETMTLIAPELKDGVVVMDTGPIKEVVQTWASELLPDGRHYVGLTPVINPSYLFEEKAGVDAARADLFHGGLMAIVAPPDTTSEAVKLAADLTRLLGAMPLFADPAEIDGLMAGTHLLPQLLAAALLNATVDQPGWREGRKVAGRGYAEATGPVAHLGDARALTASVMHNQGNVLRVLDSTLAALQALRNDIQQKDEDALVERLERAQDGRDEWLQDRQAGEWVSDSMPSTELPESGGILGRLFGVGRKPRPKK